MNGMISSGYQFLSANVPFRNYRLLIDNYMAISETIEKDLLLFGFYCPLQLNVADKTNNFTIIKIV